jgi:hypothetical protein
MSLAAGTKSASPATKISYGAALNTTLACHVCQLSGIYEKAQRVGQGDSVTLQQLVQLSELFEDLAADQEQIDRKRHKFQDLRDRNGEAADPSKRYDRRPQSRYGGLYEEVDRFSPQPQLESQFAENGSGKRKVYLRAHVTIAARS